MDLPSDDDTSENAYNIYLKLVNSKREYRKKLQAAYNNTKERIPKDENALTRLMGDIQNTDTKIFEFQGKLENIREKRTSPGVMPITAQTIEIVLPNGTCTVVAERGMTMEQVCRKNNRFNHLDLNQSHLEEHTIGKDHKSKKTLVNWNEQSEKFSNGQLWLMTKDDNYLRSIAPTTHSFELQQMKFKPFRQCSMCHKMSLLGISKHLWKCSYESENRQQVCGLIICSNCKDTKLTQPCIGVPKPVGVPEVERPQTDPDTDNWKINSEDVEDWVEVGAGTWGRVYKAKWHGKVAVKQLKCKNPTDEEQRNFENEVRMLRKTRHELIVLFMGYILEPNKLCIVMSWCQSSLYKKLHVKSEEMSRLEAISIAREIAQGMGYLHSKTVDILHRDLKSANIFLQSDAGGSVRHKVKIGDFGLATTTSRPKTRGAHVKQEKTIMGSLPWMAPELMRSPPPYSYESDMYAFGCVLFEIFAGELPYANQKALRPEMIMFNVSSGRWRPAIDRLNPREGSSCIGSPSTPDRVRELMIRCYEKDPKKRPKFEIGEGNPVEVLAELEREEEEDMKRREERFERRDLMTRCNSLSTFDKSRYKLSSGNETPNISEPNELTDLRRN